MDYPFMHKRPQNFFLHKNSLFKKEGKMKRDTTFWNRFCVLEPDAKKYVIPLVITPNSETCVLLFGYCDLLLRVSLDLSQCLVKESVPTRYVFSRNTQHCAEVLGDLMDLDYLNNLVDILDTHFILQSQ